MMSGAHPFDAAALTYDEIFTQRRLGSWLREMVRERLPFQPGDHILELGCGTGEDALWLAQRGISVMATDASAGMLARARQKIAAGGQEKQVAFEVFDMNLPASVSPAIGEGYAGALANFGALNCVVDRQRLPGVLAQRLRR